jgi:hypothetical protein
MARRSELVAHDVGDFEIVEFDRDGPDVVLVPMELGGIGDRLESLG